jgi:hypothetical protein
MIVVKTRLRRIPNTCATCSISYIDPWGLRVCGVNKKECPEEVKPSGRIGYGKPSWCPLAKVEGWWSEC